MDDADFEWLSQWKWFLHSNGYAVRSIRGGTVFMHRQITNAAPATEVDHCNRDKLDNRRDNLRVCSVRQNQHNRAPRQGRETPYKGVRLRGRRWEARITVDGHERNLGRFATDIEAARAYDAAAVRFFGEFARTNFPADGGL